MNTLETDKYIYIFVKDDVRPILKGQLYYDTACNFDGEHCIKIAQEDIPVDKINAQALILSITLK